MQSNVHLILLSFMQDVDTNFLNKSDLEANVETLAQEIDFLKTLYMEVRAHSFPLSHTRSVLSLDSLAASPELAYFLTFGVIHLSYHSNLYPLYVNASTSGEG